MVSEGQSCRRCASPSCSFFAWLSSNVATPPLISFTPSRWQRAAQLHSAMREKPFGLQSQVGDEQTSSQSREIQSDLYKVSIFHWNFQVENDPDHRYCVSLQVGSSLPAVTLVHQNRGPSTARCHHRVCPAMTTVVHVSLLATSKRTRETASPELCSPSTGCLTTT